MKLFKSICIITDTKHATSKGLDVNSGFNVHVLYLKIQLFWIYQIYLL